MEERRHEEPMSKNGGTTSNMSPEETGQTEWMGFIVSAIKNLHVHDHQHTDGHSSNEILHDIGTQVAVLWRWRPILILFCFPIQMCAGVCSLQQAIPLGKSLNPGLWYYSFK